MVRAVARYLRQAGIPFSDRYMEETLLAHAGRGARARRSCSTRASIPTGDRDARRGLRGARSRRRSTPSTASTRTGSCAASCRVVRAMLRTNYFLPGPKPYVSFKLDPTQVPLTPLPRPRFEIFVHSPRVEGVHLRGGSVARGGLRWSDRREDFRTEILGLMKAQMVKNALIVPVGRQGRVRGQARRRPGRRVLHDVHQRRCWTSPTRSPAARSCRRRTSCATTATTRTWSSPPTRARRRSRDIANGVAEEYGFWLGDAFASGGSVGYDHKAMGITARSAWVSVQRHFRELGVDVQSRGLHRRRHRRHERRRVRQRHAALAAHPARGGVRPPPHLPRPGPRRGGRRCAERRRLFELPRSSWDDYDTRADLRGRRRLPAHREVDRAVAAGARGAGRRRRAADAERADARRSCARRSTCCGTAASAPT